MDGKWYGVRITKFGAGKAQFPQKMVFVTEWEAEEKGRKPGRYFHILTDTGGYRWFPRSRLTWRASDQPPEELIADPVIEEPEPDPVIEEPDPEPEEITPGPEPEEPEASEEQLYVTPESYSQLPEDWRQIFVRKVRGK